MATEYEARRDRLISAAKKVKATEDIAIAGRAREGHWGKEPIVEMIVSLAEREYGDAKAELAAATKALDEWADEALRYGSLG